MTAAGRIRVVHVLTTLDVGGAQGRLLDLCRRLPEYGVDVSAVYLKGDGPMAESFRASGVGVSKVNMRFVADPIATVALARELRRSTPDIVHTHMFKADLHGLLAAKLARVPHVVTTKHGAEEARRFRPVAALDRWLARESDAVVCISRDLAHFTTEVEGVPPEQIRVIYNRIDTARMVSRRPREEVRRQIGVRAGEPLVMTTARLHHSKGLDVLIDAMRLVRVDLPSARLAIVGDGEERERLERLARPDGDAVLFLGMRSDVPDLLAACDCYAQPSLREGLGLALAEAMTMELPCVAANAAALPEIVTDGLDGLLVPPGDASALAGAIVRLLSDDELAQRLARAGRHTAVTRFDVQTMVDEYVALYREIAGRDVAGVREGRRGVR
jgi:glycosyltransferase involved in cell wall biosynthesis